MKLEHLALATALMGSIGESPSMRTAPIATGTGRPGTKARRAKRKKQRQQAKASRK